MRQRVVDLEKETKTLKIQIRRYQEEILRKDKKEVHKRNSVSGEGNQKINVENFGI